MEIKLAGRVIPRNVKGDPAFSRTSSPTRDEAFTEEEQDELVNRALYQLEYQRESHRKRGVIERARQKALKQALKGNRTEIDRQLKGE